MAVWDNPTGSTPPDVPRISICFPYTIDVTMQWAMQSLGPLCFVPIPWCEKLPRMCRGLPLNVARDEIVKLSLADPKVTHLLWVDTDNIAESPKDINESLRALYQCNVPIVSGLYRAKQKEGFTYAAWMDAKLPDKIAYIPIQNWTGNFIEVDTIGFGFCLIKREVFEKIPPPWFPWNTPSPSEDFNFCRTAKAHGYKINVLTDVKIGHIGQLYIDVDGKVKTLEL